MKNCSSRRQPQNEDDIKIKDNNKNEQTAKKEDNHQNEDVLATS